MRLCAVILGMLVISATPARILIATHGFDGPVRSGGIATFSAALAGVLKVCKRKNNDFLH